MRQRTLAALFALFVSIPAVHAADSAQGTFTLDGKPIKLRYAYAVSGPDTFDETKKAYLLILSEKPIAASDIKAADSFVGLGGKSVRSLLESGMALEIHPDGKGYHLTVRHSALNGKEIQESASWGLDVPTLGPDRLKGTFASSSSMMGKGAGDGGKEEIGIGHTASFKINFDVPVDRNFPLEQKIELSASAKKLPAGGGDPGKAWIAQTCKPLPAVPNTKDPKAVEKYLRDQGMTDKDLNDEIARQAKLKGHPVTKEEALKSMADMISAMSQLAAAMTPTDCKVLGGSADDKVAIIQVEGKMSGEKQLTDVTMVKDGTAWTVKKTGAWRSGK